VRGTGSGTWYTTPRRIRYVMGIQSWYTTWIRDTLKYNNRYAMNRKTIYYLKNYLSPLNKASLIIFTISIQYWYWSPGPVLYIWMPWGNYKMAPL